MSARNQRLASTSLLRMTDTALQRAQKGLRISDVYMRQAAFCVADSYEHRSVDQHRIQPQFRNVVEKSEVLVEEGDGSHQQLFRVHLDFGCRWGTFSSDSEPSEDDEGFDELGRIEAKYVVEYEIIEELSSECRDAFALANASYHVWPYWREYITSSCDRLNVPKILTPMFQPAQNRHAEIVSGQDE